jgi:hypothetical protein
MIEAQERVILLISYEFRGTGICKNFVSRLRPGGGNSCHKAKRGRATKYTLGQVGMLLQLRESVTLQ